MTSLSWSTMIIVSLEEWLFFKTGQIFGVLSECHLEIGQYFIARKWAKKELKLAASSGSLKLEAGALR